MKSAMAFVLFLFAPMTIRAAEMEWLRVSDDKTGFVMEKSGKKFTPWGFNYDHDEQGRLIEDFREMRDLGANVVRIHLQFGKFMESETQPNAKSLEMLGRLVKLAAQTNLYLDLTGLGCYHKQDVPAWYDELSEALRWTAQGAFWEAIAKTCKDSPAVFFYDLMNEPVAPAGKKKGTDWLGPPFGNKHFVQRISLEQNDRPRPDIARVWIAQLVQAIRKHDRRHLVTVGLVDWSLDRPGLQSGFVPEKIAPELDFLCVHLYPKKGKLDEDLKTLAGFNVGKPVIIEETFVLHAGFEDFEKFLDASKPHAAGWIGFYWGKTLAECRESKTFGDALMAGWLELFVRRAGESR
jgi:hypothetical protein